MSKEESKEGAFPRAEVREKDGEISASVDETNRIRAMLGLPPLKVEKEDKVVTVDVGEKQKKDADDVDVLAMRQRMHQRRLQRELLSEATEESDLSLTDFLSQSRKSKKEEKEEKKRRHKARLAVDEEDLDHIAEDAKKQLSTSEALKGAKISHSGEKLNRLLSEAQSGVILTLKDSRLLDDKGELVEDTGVELESAALLQQDAEEVRRQRQTAVTEQGQSALGFSSMVQKTSVAVADAMAQAQTAAAQQEESVTLGEDGNLALSSMDLGIVGRGHEAVEGDEMFFTQAAVMPTIASSNHGGGKGSKAFKKKKKRGSKRSRRQQESEATASWADEAEVVEEDEEDDTSTTTMSMTALASAQSHLFQESGVSAAPQEKRSREWKYQRALDRAAADTALLRDTTADELAMEAEQEEFDALLRHARRKKERREKQKQRSVVAVLKQSKSAPLKAERKGVKMEDLKFSDDAITEHPEEGVRHVKDENALTEAAEFADGFEAARDDNEDDDIIRRRKRRRIKQEPSDEAEAEAAQATSGDAKAESGEAVKEATEATRTDDWMSGFTSRRGVSTALSRVRARKINPELQREFMTGRANDKVRKDYIQQQVEGQRGERRAYLEFRDAQGRLVTEKQYMRILSERFHGQAIGKNNVDRHQRRLRDAHKRMVKGAGGRHF